MRHYEIVFIVHPDQSEQVPAMVDRYRNLVIERGGAIHRVEDWGRRQLAYLINKFSKAHYICINIECDYETLQELETAFRFNDAILRHLTVKMKKAETGPSPMMRSAQKEEAPKGRSTQPQAAAVASASAPEAAPEAAPVPEPAPAPEPEPASEPVAEPAAAVSEEKAVQEEEAPAGADEPSE